MDPRFTAGSLPHRHFLGVDCPACEALRANSMLDSSLPFDTAAEIWLKTHSQYIRPSTARIYSVQCKVFAGFFQSLPLSQFHIGHVRSYQGWRQERACNDVINKEIRSILVPILKEVDRWHHIEGVYRTLPVRKKIVRKSMSEEEERRFLAVALDSARSHRILAGHCLVIMHETTMGFGELRHLKREDVVLNEEIPYVTVNEGCKNDFRIRTIPLNWLALRSMRWILHRWEDLGGTESAQYILPGHARHPKGEKRQRNAPPDFRKPMTKITRAAQAIFKEAGLPDFLVYDMRSCAITKLRNNAELSEQMQQEIAGHSNAQIARLYSRQRLEKKAVAMEKIAVEQEPRFGGLVAFPGGRKKS